LVAIAVTIVGYPANFQALTHPGNRSAVLAQSPPAFTTPQTEEPATPSPPPPSSSPSNKPTTASPSPTSSPSASPIAPTLPPIPPASTAPPLTLGSNYSDPSGRFKIGVIKDFKVSPLAGSVLIESADGNLAYSVVVQAQPSGLPIGLSAIDNGESLSKAATTVFQRGESFQPGQPQLEAGGGVVINWTGTLTIAGNTQPMGGVILVRPSPKQLLLVLIAATQAGAGQVPEAVSAIASSLQSL
jgi:hypothetical protein